MPIIPTKNSEVAVQAPAPSMIPNTRMTNAVGEGMLAEAKNQAVEGDIIGTVVSKLGEAYDKRVVEAETSDTNVKLEQWKQEQVTKDAAARDSVQGYGVGFANQRLEERYKDGEKFIGSLPQRQQERARESIANYQSGRITDDTNFEIKRRAQHQTDLTNKAVDTDASELAKNPDVGLAQQKIRQREKEIDEGPLNAEEKEKEKQRYRDSILSAQNAEAIARRNGQNASAVATMGAPSVQAGFNVLQQAENAGVPENERDTKTGGNGGIGRAGVKPEVARADLARQGRPEAKLDDAGLAEWLKKNPTEAVDIGRRNWVAQLERFKSPNGTYDYQAAAIAYRDGPEVAQRFIEKGRDLNQLDQGTRTYLEKFRDGFAGPGPQQGSLGMQPQGLGGPSQAVTPQAYFGAGVDVSKLPAGMRNNNPGNLKFSGSEWQRQNFPGMVGPSVNTDQGDPQIVFNSPQAGMRAMASLALTKFDGGKTTVNDLIAGQGGWTPGHTEAAKNIAATMGISPTAQVNLRDPQQLRSFMSALISQEHGNEGKRYSADLIGQGADSALGVRAQAPVGNVPNATLIQQANPGAAAPRGPGSWITADTPRRPGDTYSFSDFKNDGVHGGTAGGKAQIHSSVVDVANSVASTIGTKLPVTSAFRSEGYNAQVANSSKSVHTSGRAIDMDLKGLDDTQKQAAVRQAVIAGATGLGTYPNGSMHVDTREASGRGPGGLSLWYGNNNGSWENAPAWFKNGVQEGLAARGQAPGGGAPGVAPNPVNVANPQADMSPGAVAGTAGGGMLSSLTPDPGPFRQQLPGESYANWAKERDKHDANRNQIIAARNAADGSAIKELNSNNQTERQAALADFTNKLFTGEANRNDIQRALDSGLVRDNKELHTVLQAEAQYQSAVDRGMQAYQAQRNADRAAYVEQQKQKSMLGQLEETDVMTDMRAGRVTADEASSLINKIRSWKKGQDGGASAVARVQTGAIGSAYNKEDRDVANTAYDHLVKNSGATDQAGIDASAAKEAQAIVRKWGFVPDDHVEKLAGQITSNNEKRVIAAASEAMQLLQVNPRALDQAGPAGEALLRATTSYATMLSQGLEEPEIAARLKKQADPKSIKEAEEGLKKGGAFYDSMKAVQDMSAGDIAAKIGKAGSGWIFGGPSTGVGEKFGGLTRLSPQGEAALKAEYESIYRRELIYTQDPKQAENSATTLMSKNFGQTQFGGQDLARGPLFTSFDNGAFVKYPAEKIMGRHLEHWDQPTIDKEIERQAREHLIANGVTSKPGRIAIIPQFAAPKQGTDQGGRDQNPYAIAYVKRDGTIDFAKKAFFFDVGGARGRATQIAAEGGNAWGNLVGQMNAASEARNAPPAGASAF